MGTIPSNTPNGNVQTNCLMQVPVMVSTTDSFVFGSVSSSKITRTLNTLSDEDTSQESSSFCTVVAESHMVDEPRPIISKIWHKILKTNPRYTEFAFCRLLTTKPKLRGIFGLTEQAGNYFDCNCLDNEFIAGHARKLRDFLNRVIFHMEVHGQSMIADCRKLGRLHTDFCKTPCKPTTVNGSDNSLAPECPDDFIPIDAWIVFAKAFVDEMKETYAVCKDHEDDIDSEVHYIYPYNVSSSDSILEEQHHYVLLTINEMKETYAVCKDHEDDIDPEAHYSAWAHFINSVVQNVRQAFEEEVRGRARRSRSCPPPSQ